MDGRIRASVIGVSGYTGLELVRLLLAHPRVEIGALTSRQHDDISLGDLAPHLRGYDYRVTSTAYEEVADNSDVVFLCLPHKTTAEVIPSLLGKCRIVDLSADFRLKDTHAYQKYYGQAHPCPEYLPEFVYGLPETNREAIQGARNVANPGCFALLGQLLLYPFRGYIESAKILAITGSSGLGKSPVEGGHHPVRNHNMKSYSVNAHRHTPEITATAQINESQLDFVPTSGPFTRGIFATAFISLDVTPAKAGAQNSQALDARLRGHDSYKDSPFIREGGEVALANIVGSNYADLSFRKGAESNTIIAQGAIDNLVKGASGCAVQNMNLMFGFEETEGLKGFSPMYP